jgi:hypothetical protein
MKQHHVISLLQTNYRTVACQFLFNRDGTPANATSATKYTYKVSDKILLQPEDYCIIIAPSGVPQVVRVVSVDTKPKLDLDADFSYKWIVQKVDITAYNEQLAAEEAFREVLNDIERENQREILLKEFTNRMPEGSAARLKFDRAVQQFTLQAPQVVQAPSGPLAPLHDEMWTPAPPVVREPV